MLLQIMLTQPSLFKVICCFKAVPIIICLVLGTLCSATGILMMILQFFATAAWHSILLFHACLPDYYCISLSVFYLNILCRYFLLYHSIRWFAAQFNPPANHKDLWQCAGVFLSYSRWLVSQFKVCYYVIFLYTFHPSAFRMSIRYSTSYNNSRL